MDAVNENGSPSETPTPILGESDLDRDADTRLASYLNSVPYKCESNDDMQQKLQFVVGRIVLCAQSRDWRSLSTWIGVFQWSAPILHLG
jgi:proteasome activator subunit 4